jgi:hypothetical protein
MIVLPEKNLEFEYENGFYLTCEVSRIGKFIAHYELYKSIDHLSGAIVECGVYKGVSLTRFAMFRNLFEKQIKRKIVAFDTFDTFPKTQFEEDIPLRQNFIDESGDQSIGKSQLLEILNEKNCGESLDLISGDICETVPEFVSNNPDLKIALLNLDVDIYEPSVVILEYLFPLLVKGGILILDDYGTFPGESQAVDDYFKGQSIEIQKFPFCKTPRYIIKI